MVATSPFRWTVRAALAVLVAAGRPAPAPAQPAAGPRAAPAATPSRPPEPAVASYVSHRLNGKPLPVTDRVTDSTGVQYLIEFDELILSIREKHEFRAALRFRQTLAAKGMRMGQDPMQKMVVYGTWSVVGRELRFVPDPKRGGNGLRILTGTFTAHEIDVPFDYRNGTVARRAAVVLIRDDRII
jgi:hypothetical protein